MFSQVFTHDRKARRLLKELLKLMETTQELTQLRWTKLLKMRTPRRQPAGDTEDIDSNYFEDEPVGVFPAGSLYARGSPPSLSDPLEVDPFVRASLAWRRADHAPPAPPTPPPPPSPRRLRPRLRRT